MALDIRTLYIIYTNLPKHEVKIPSFKRWCFFEGHKHIPQAQVIAAKKFMSDLTEEIEDEALRNKGYTVTKYGFSTKPNDQDFLKLHFDLIIKS